MANICWYQIRAKGKKKNVYMIYHTMPCCDDITIKSKKGNNNDYTLIFSGSCKWSLDAYCDNSTNKLKIDVEEYVDEDGGLLKDVTDYWYYTLKDKSKIYDCEIEAFTEYEDYDVEEDEGDKPTFEHYKDGKKIERKKLSFKEAKKKASKLFDLKNIIPNVYDDDYDPDYESDKESEKYSVSEEDKLVNSLIKYPKYLETKYPEYKNDKEIILKVTPKNYNIVKYASDELQKNREFVLEAVKQDGNSLRYASKELKNDKEIVLEAVKQNSDVLEYASKELRNDKEVVLSAVKQDGFGLSLRFASERLKDDKEVVLEAVKHGFYSTLEFASERLKDDKEIVLEAVKKAASGDALEFASERLKDDKEVVLEAVKHGFYSTLEYASERLKDDEDVVLTAIKVNSYALGYASKRLQEKFKNSKN